MSKDVCSLFGLMGDPKHKSSPLLVSDTKLGVEIELEGFRNGAPDVDQNFWEVKSDGSLRDNGLEFIFRQPIMGADVISALKDFAENIGKPKVSSRCSVHVHVDFRDANFNQILNFLMVYLVFERSLIKYHGDAREDNIFCLPFYRAEVALMNVIKAIHKDEGSIAKSFNGQEERYNALNVKSLPRFGSIEARHMPGSYDTKKILEWINILLSMKKFAMSSEELINIPAIFSGLGPEHFTHEVFGEYSKAILYPNMDMDMYNGVRLAQDVYFSNDAISTSEFLEEFNDGVVISNLYANVYQNVHGKKLEIEEQIISDEE